MFTRRLTLYKLTVVLILACLVTTLGSSASSTHSVYLSVPLYCQEQSIWCGAASGQMTHNGYPTPPGAQFFSQTSVWNCIQANKDDPAVNWATDPDGLAFSLNNMGHPPSGIWLIVDKSTYQDEMFDITYWMTRQRYPTPALIWNQQHWVVITGFTTDVDPTTSSSITLQWIEFNDPWPPCSDGLSSGGTYHYVSGATWQSNYFWGPVNISSSKWYGKYIAVLEPPKVEGRVRLEKIVKRGEPIPPEKAIKLALEWIDRLKLYEKKPLSILRETKPFEPLLVNREYGGYYIVPFGFEPEKIPAGVIVNAYTGEFQDAASFGVPIRYLPEKKAIEIILEYTGVRQVERPQLIFEPSEQTESYYWPLWKFTIKEVVLYVNQLGKVFEELTLPPPGN